MDEGIGEAAPVVGLRMVSTIGSAAMDEASEATPVGWMRVR